MPKATWFRAVLAMLWLNGTLSSVAKGEWLAVGWAVLAGFWMFSAFYHEDRAAG